MKTLFLFALLFFATHLFAQFTVPSSGNSAYTVCSGVLYDSGGQFGNHTDGSNGYTVLNPSTSGNLVQVSGISNGENCCDFINIFNGAGIGGNLLWSSNPGFGSIPTITSTAGPLTVQFFSNSNIVGNGFALDINCVPPVTFTVPTTGNNSYTVCSGVLYDSGGPSNNYSNNSNGYTVLNPSNPGNIVQVTGTSVGENSSDFIRIYNGAGLSGNLLWAGSPGGGVIPTITSTAGSLTIEFTSNGSTVGAGFVLDIVCLPPQTFIVPTQGQNSYTICSGILYDSGGPFGNHTDDSNGYTVLNPSNPGNMVQISGTSDGQNCCDFINIFNGAGIGGNLLWSSNPGFGSIPTITSTSGPLTVQFFSNSGIVGNGFALDINCVPPVTFTVPTTGNNSYTVCSGVLYDSGGPTNDYSNNSNGYTVLNPSNPGNMVQVSGASVGENSSDFIRIYNGAGLSGNLLWAGSPGGGVIPSITSTAGPLTIEFTSNASTVGVGFALDIICLPPQTFIVPTQGQNSYTVCSGVLYDSGGPFGNHTDDSNGYTVLNPSNPGNLIQISGISDGQNCCDLINIFNGVGLGGNLLWSSNPGFGSIPTITSTSGPLTVQFFSNSNIVGNGFALDINCIIGTSCTPTIAINSNLGTSICQGQQVVFTAAITNGGANPAYQWKRNGFNVGTSSATFTTGTINNGDVVTCQLTSNVACALQNVVTSNALTMIVNSSASPSFTQVPEICAGTSLSPLPTTSNNGIIGSWTPALNNNLTTNYTFTPNSGQCSSTVATMTIVVSQNPVVTLVLNGTTLIANAGFNTYAWTFNGSTIQGANTNEITANVIGIYAVTVTDNNECSNTATFNLQTVGLEKIGFTNTFSIFPNPSNGKATVSIDFSKNQNVKILVLDLQGKLQMQKTCTFIAGKNEIPLDLSELSDGIYFIRLENSEFRQTKSFAKMSN